MMQPSSPLTSPSPTSRWDILWYLLAAYGGHTLLIAVLLLILALSEDAWRFVRAFTQFVFLGGTVWLLGERRGRFSWAELGLFPPRWQRKWLWAILGIALALGVFNRLSEQVIIWLRQGNLNMISFSGDMPWRALAVVWLSTALLIPLAEELFFRGAVYFWFERIYGSLAALIGSAALYAITRVTFFSANSPLDVVQSLVMGIVTAFALQRTRSLWVPILIHVLAFTLALFMTTLRALL